MSLRGRTDHVTLLRAAIARIERGAPASGYPAGRPAPSRGDTAPIPLGPAGFALDRLLGGGLRRGTLHEIAPASARDEGAASRFAVAVAVCGMSAHGALVWIVDDCAAGESGAPYRPGLQGHGLDPERLIVVRTRGGQQTLWAAEEALRGSGSVVLAELWGGKAYGLAASRRLVLAARARGSTALLLHAGWGAGATLSTSCETRMVVAAHPSRRRPAAIGALPVPGAPAFALRLDKARAALADIDPHQVFALHWNATQRCFHDPDHPVSLAAPPADGPDRAAPKRILPRRLLPRRLAR